MTFDFDVASYTPYRIIDLSSYHNTLLVQFKQILYQTCTFLKEVDFIFERLKRIKSRKSAENPALLVFSIMESGILAAEEEKS